MRRFLLAAPAPLDAFNHFRIAMQREERTCVSLMTHSEARQIVAGTSHGPSNIQRLTSDLRSFLIATRANRNDLNSSNINETYRSNRNKMRGVFAVVDGRGISLHHSLIISNRQCFPIRNAPNSFSINENFISNRQWGLDKSLIRGYLEILVFYGAGSRMPAWKARRPLHGQRQRRDAGLRDESASARQAGLKAPLPSSGRAGATFKPDGKRKAPT